MYNDVSETKAATTAAQAKAAEGGGTRNKDRLERDKKNYSDVQNARCENNEMPPLSSGSGIARTYSYENTIFFSIRRGPHGQLCSSPCTRGIRYASV